MFSELHLCIEDKGPRMKEIGAGNKNTERQREWELTWKRILTEKEEPKERAPGNRRLRTLTPESGNSEIEDRLSLSSSGSDSLTEDGLQN